MSNKTPLSSTSSTVNSSLTCQDRTVSLDNSSRALVASASAEQTHHLSADVEMNRALGDASMMVRHTLHNPQNAIEQAR